MSPKEVAIETAIKAIKEAQIAKVKAEILEAAVRKEKQAAGQSEAAKAHMANAVPRTQHNDRFAPPESRLPPLPVPSPAPTAAPVKHIQRNHKPCQFLKLSGLSSNEPGFEMLGVYKHLTLSENKLWRHRVGGEVHSTKPREQQRLNNIYEMVSQTPDAKKAWAKLGVLMKKRKQVLEEMKNPSQSMRTRPDPKTETIEALLHASLSDHPADPVKMLASKLRHVNRDISAQTDLLKRSQNLLYYSPQYSEWVVQGFRESSSGRDATMDGMFQLASSDDVVVPEHVIEWSVRVGVDYIPNLAVKARCMSINQWPTRPPSPSPPTPSPTAPTAPPSQAPTASACGCQGTSVEGEGAMCSHW
jgi:hypothetical protein